MLSETIGDKMFKKICALLTKKPKQPDFPVKMELAVILEKIDKKKPALKKATTLKPAAKKVAVKKTVKKK